MSRCLLSDHQDGGIDVAIGDGRHHRCINDPQSLQAVDPKVWRGHGHGMGPHLAGAGSGGKHSPGSPNKFEDFLVGLDIRSRRKLVSTEGGETRLAEDTSGAADGLDPLALVLLGGEVVEDDLWVLRRVGRADRTCPLTSLRTGPTWTW